MTTQKTSFQKMIEELLDGTQRLSRRSLQEFSDIDPGSITTLMQSWPNIKPETKRFLLEGLQSLAGRDTLVSFDDFARALLNDPDAQVRARAIQLLDKCDDLKLIPAFLRILASDENIDARAEAASALGKYVELGELEEISKKTRRLVEDALLEKANSQDNLLVRRNALEALGFSSRAEIVTLIESAFHRENPDWQASALFAMGRSADDRWEELVLSSMMDEFPIVRLAAVEAAGELGLAAAGPVLLKVLEDEEDDEIASAAIWSLSQIGGEDARVYLESLVDLAEDDDQVEFLEEALDNLAFTEDMSKFDLLNLDSDEQLMDIDNQGEE
jgi:HEAT repeat protein